jgi:hypothetical protein
MIERAELPTRPFQTSFSFVARRKKRARALFKLFKLIDMYRSRRRQQAGQA